MLMVLRQILQYHSKNNGNACPKLTLGCQKKKLKPETGQLASCQPEIKMSSLAHAHSVTPGRFSFNGRI